MKTFSHLWQNLAKFFSRWEIFQTKAVGKFKTRILFSIIFSQNSCRLWENVRKHSTAIQPTDDNTAHALCTWDNKATHIYGTCNIYCFSIAKMATRTRLNVTLYVHCLSCPDLPPVYSNKAAITYGRESVLCTEGKKMWQSFVLGKAQVASITVTPTSDAHD